MLASDWGFYKQVIYEFIVDLCKRNKDGKLLVFQALQIKAGVVVDLELLKTDTYEDIGDMA